MFNEFTAYYQCATYLCALQDPGVLNVVGFVHDAIYTVGHNVNHHLEPKEGDLPTQFTGGDQKEYGPSMVLHKKENKQTKYI